MSCRSVLLVHKSCVPANHWQKDQTHFATRGNWTNKFSTDWHWLHK